jgi:hypothetical protein
MHLTTANHQPQQQAVHHRRVFGHNSAFYQRDQQRLPQTHFIKRGLLLDNKIVTALNSRSGRVVRRRQVGDKASLKLSRSFADAEDEQVSGELQWG